MYKLVVSDIDETLITKDGVVTPENIAAIQAVQDKGITFMLATGRSFNDFQRILTDLGTVGLEKHYSISYNGGVITENKNNKILYKNALEQDFVHQIFEIGATYDGVLIHLFALHHTFTYRMTESERNFMDNPFQLEELTDANLDFLGDMEILKINFQADDMEQLRAIHQQLPQEVISNHDINYSSGRYLEFNPKGINKGEAVRVVAKEMGITPSEILCIGDNINDLSMVRYAGTGVSVANGVPELKEIADHICDNDHNNSAVAEAFNHFVLKK
ncbi:HAD family phosphatase [Vagococcus coleopterorum]|uniref:HAD family phosphatase n=1 Tax=Vagococcus coleopterorum TaxID=2714946 RepID=A0A6G8AMY5_9ENTE|nr:Cof-type HAD-IIB family hydrolase [Vagococcus coleopterorum]QIL46428.1 HAD family phosphatase [Vagococcus coleopterorum]